VITLAEWEAMNKDKVEDERDESPEEGEEENQEEVIKEVDEGAMLVRRRALSSQRSEKEEQRENIFPSRCTIQGKVCSLFIDGGNYTNVVSLSMIEKLNLLTSAHPIHITSYG